MFSVAGPTVWDLLPDQLRDSDGTESTFRNHSSHSSSTSISVLKCIRGVFNYAQYKSTFYLLDLRSTEETKQQL